MLGRVEDQEGAGLAQQAVRSPALPYLTAPQDHVGLPRLRDPHTDPRVKLPAQRGAAFVGTLQLLSARPLCGDDQLDAGSPAQAGDPLHMPQSDRIELRDLVDDDEQERLKRRRPPPPPVALGEQAHASVKSAVSGLQERFGVGR